MQNQIQLNKAKTGENKKAEDNETTEENAKAEENNSMEENENTEEKARGKRIQKVIERFELIKSK